MDITLRHPSWLHPIDTYIILCIQLYIYTYIYIHIANEMPINIHQRLPPQNPEHGNGKSTMNEDIVPIQNSTWEFSS